ncbi:hypothetical protein GTY75_09130 [Streptomyces sp. SID8381]|uniref:hypothetical protein n=1 Tax=unclassified Streptomyces TaxID=2593676 RepID=UPI00036DDADC|nr:MULTISPECIES: hypothetical protein [unclassified Streptomyces]MYX26829.1 hypothetical protein [Streptomyces sp. SID8381]
MTTCTEFATTVLDFRTGPMTVQRLAVMPGDVFHDGGARYLVLNAWYPSNPPFGIRQMLTVAALSHADTRGILGTLTMGLNVDFARTQDATVEAPEPHPRRWWVAAAVDDTGRFDGANGFRETGECARCAEQPLDPAAHHYVRCMNARMHAWNQVGNWQDSRHRLDPPRAYYVLPLLADTWEDARAQARDLCERLRTVGHL